MGEFFAENKELLISLGISLVGVLCLWAGLRGWYRRMSRLWKLESTPTSKAKGVALGLVELNGEVECADQIQSHLAETACVYYRFTIEEYYSRTKTVSDGKGGTKTETETGWEVIDQGSEWVAFLLRDDSGTIQIVPEAAGEITGNEVFSEEFQLGDHFYAAKTDAGAVSGSEGRRRFKEWAISNGDVLFVCGDAREREDVAEAEIALGDENYLCISVKTEAAVQRGMFWRSVGFWILGLIGICILPLRWMDLSEDAWKPVLLWSGGAYLLLTVIGYLLGLYNSLVDAKNRARKAEANIDVSLKRRADLVPMLRDVVEGLKAHEASLQAGLAAVRAVNCEGAALRAIAEKYPTLVAQPAFADFMTRLTDTEDRIALARSFYAESAAFYNTRIQTFPVNLGAGVLGFRALRLAVGAA